MQTKDIPVIPPCPKCQKGEETEPHPCPYQADVNGDAETLCTCCESCEGCCQDDI